MGSSNLHRHHPLIHFPDLTSDNCSVTSPGSLDYNCVAWAAGFDDCQLWPDAANAEWPAVLPQDETLETFVAYFESLGYEQCDTPDFDDGLLKVAIFADDDGPTHVARQLSSGKWASKMGWDGVDIEHDGLGCIEGQRYGRAMLFLMRPATL